MKTATDILKDVAALKERKSADYQGPQFSEEDYFPFGHQSFIQMLHTKYLRMRSVVEQENTNYESLEDTLIDMIAYASMYAAWISNQNLKEPDTSTSRDKTIEELRGRQPRNSVTYRDV